MDDMILLKEFAARHSEEAFRTLVERHINFVYSVALRQVREPHDAEEVTQEVFTDLAAKASVISRKTILSGWLFRATRFAAAKMIRSEVRRRAREQESVQMESIEQSDVESKWQRMEPLLNEALEKLSDKDRSAVLLRFFEKKPLKDIATQLSVNEAAAKKRVSRAVERLRLIFQKRGVIVPSAVLVSALSAQSLQAAPAGLASTIVTAAILKGTTLSSSGFALSKGILKIMALSKMKTAGLATVALLLAGGTTTYVVQKNRSDDAGALRIIDSMNSQVLDNAPPRLFLSAHKAPSFPGGTITVGNGKMMGKAVSAKELLGLAYGVNQSRMVLSTALPDSKYDFLVSLPTNQKEALQQAIRQRLGLVAHQETRAEDVYVLRSMPGDFPALQPSLQRGTSSSTQTRDGSIGFVNATIEALCGTLEHFLARPVLNETKLKGRFDISVTWGEAGAEREGLRQALTEQLGLETVVDKRDVEMLIVQNAAPR